MFKFIRLALILVLCVGTNLNLSAQDAALLPNAKQTFLGNDGKPLTSGKVYFYVPNTSTLKTTWQDANQNTANTNPVILDASGRAVIYGSGEYRQVVRDRNNNLIWDAVTTSTGSGGGGGSTTGDGDLVGTIKPWAGLTAPNQYLFAYGQEVSRATYSSLFTAITLSTSVFCTNGSPVLTGLADTTQIPINGAVEVSCMAPGTTVISKTSNSVTVSNNASLTTSATAVFLPWGGGNGSSTFNLPDLRGRIVAGRDNMGGTAASRLTTTYFANASAIGATGGTESKTLLTANLPPYTPAGTNSQTSFGFNASNNGTTGGGATYVISVVASGGAGTITQTAATFTGTAQGGTSTPFSIVQPTITSNYIIKVTPDTAGTINIGVTSIQSMTGDIACGTGLTCTGNTISVSSIGTVTSVGLTVPATSIFGVTGSPITTTGDLGLTTTGTSGGIPYFSSSSVISSSAALTANLPVIGGGAGSAPTVGTRSGNTTAFVTTTGALVSGNCAKWDASGNLVDNGSTCAGAGGSPGGSNTQVQFNNAGSFGGSANLTWVSPKLTLGSAGSTAGQLAFANATSGSITLQATTGALGSVTLTLPAATDTVAVLAASQAFTNKTYNGNTWTAGTGTLTIAASKTLTANNSITLAGTDSTTMTFPSVSSNIPRMVSSGTKALATSAISSATCTSAQTATATGTLTTDVVTASFNSDPTGVTGYVPLTSGMLTIIVYPTADTVNFKVCNNTSSSVTPGAITLNWSVVR